MPANLARIGLTVFAMLFAIAIGTEHQAAGRVLVVTAGPVDIAPIVRIDGAAIPDAFILDGPVAVAGFQAVPSVEAATATTDGTAAVKAAVVDELAAPTEAAPAVSADGIILASWYGPGFYGNRTACGQVYTSEILGVAHKTLPCGTLLTLTYGSRVLTVPVIDRGPYVAGRTIDLSNATRLGLGCSDLCTLRIQVLR